MLHHDRIVSAVAAISLFGVTAKPCLAQVVIDPNEVYTIEAPNFQNVIDDHFEIDDGTIEAVGTGVNGPRVIFNGTFDLAGDALFVGTPAPTAFGSGSIYIDFYNNISGAGGLTLEGDRADSYADRYRAQYRFFGGAHSYTGPTTIRNATARFEVALSAGTPLLTLDNAAATFFHDLSSPVYATNFGGIALAGLNNSANITLNGGKVWSGASSGDITLSSALTLFGGGIIEADGENFHITGGVVGNGTLFASAKSDNALIFDSVIGHNGGMRITGGNVHLNHTNTFPAAVQIESGILHVNEDNTFSRLRLARGASQLHVAAGKTLSVTEDSTVRFEGGWLNIEGTVAGVDTYELVGMNDADLTAIGAGSTAELLIQRGRARVKNDTALGSDSGIVTVNSPTYAMIAVQPGVTLGRDVYLNNSMGYEFNGSLYGEGGGSSAVSGDVHLGDGGSIIGAGDVLTLSGAIHGGDLTVRGNEGGGASANGVRITGDQHTYTGQTNVLRGKLLLTDNGSLHSTSHIEVGLGGYDPQFVIDNTGTADLADRVGDAIAVGLHDAQLTLLGNGTAATTETLGDLAIKTGLSRISTKNATLTVNRLQRPEHGAVIFTDLPDTGGAGKVLLTNAPTLDNGIIGPWAVIQSGTTDRLSFATYDPTDGIKGIASYVSDLNTAAATDHVSTDFVDTYTLSADTTIAAMRLREGPGINDPHTLDLDGHTLNIVTGGLIKDDGKHSYITNGTLTAGGTGDGELIIFDRGIGSSQTFEIHADIADNASGGVVSFTKAGYGKTILTGDLTYSGATTVNRGILDIDSPDGLPVGTDLNVHGGELWMNTGTQDAVISLGTVSVTNNAKLWGGGDGSLLFDAEQWHLQSGWIDARLAGNGTLTKTTLGQARISGNDNTNYSGNIEVLEGVLVAEGTNVLGAATATVHTGARLDVRGVNVGGHLVLNGGELTGGSVTYTGLVDIASDSSIFATANDLTLSGQVTGNGGLTLGGPSTVSLRLQGDNSGYHGDIHAIGAVIRPEHQYALGDGDVYVHDAATLRFFNDLNFGTIHSLNGTIEANNFEAIDVLGTLELNGVTDFRVGDAHDLTLTGTVVLHDHVQVNKFGHDHSLNLDGTLLVGEDTEIYINEGSMRVTGLIRTNTVNASLNLVRGSHLELDADVEIQDGHTLSLTVDQQRGQLMVDAPGQSLYGSGQINADLLLSNGAQLQPGNSPGTLTVTHNATLGSDGIYDWQINDATGAAGQAVGWDLFVVGNQLLIDASADNPFTIRLVSLDGFDNAGTLLHFDPNRSYTWQIAQADQLDIGALVLDTSAFTAHNAVSPDGVFGWQADGSSLFITYTVPEPSSLLLLVSLTGILAACGRHSRICGSD